MAVHWKPPGGAEPPRTILEVVIRRCKVCEWEGESIESPDANPDCPWCHGPTERKAALASTTT